MNQSEHKMINTKKVKNYTILLSILCLQLLTAQLADGKTTVAILDFENTSGIAKYDGFGKAMSNMLITDLKNSLVEFKITVFFNY